MVSITAGGVVFTINMVIALWSLPVSPDVLDRQQMTSRRRCDERVLLRQVSGIDGHSYGSSGPDD